MPRNEWFHIAEVMQKREHALICKLLDLFDEATDHSEIAKRSEIIVREHLLGTGRRTDVKPEIKELSEVDSDTRNKLLKLLGASERQETAFSHPIEVKVQKLTKSGKPRKQRSDKGKARGKRESK